MHGIRPGLIVAAVFLGVFAVSYLFLQFNSGPEQGASSPAESGTGERAATEPSSTAAESAGSPPAYEGAVEDVEMPPAAHDSLPSPPPVAMPPAAHDPSPTATMPPAAAGDPPPTASVVKNGHGGTKVLSYFQHAKTQVDTRKAFGFVLLPKSAVTTEEKKVQKQFCEIILASMDFLTPGDAAARTDVLVTYWPIVGSRESFEIKAAFAERNCDDLLAWYDHKLARSLATKAGVAGLTGPLLITWPSSGAEGEEARNPLIVDFSKANYERATKVLQYWFRQLRNKPELWTNRIREGTIRAELADAVNDTAGVVLAVLHGKWDSLNVVEAAP